MGKEEVQNSKLTKRKIKKTVTYAITSKRIRYLGINTPKQVKDMYSEIYQPLVKEVEGNTKWWKNIACAWTGRINTVKITILSKTIYRFNAIPIRIPKHLHRTWKNNFKICIETQRPQIAKTTLRRNRDGGIRLLTSEYTTKLQ